MQPLVPPVRPPPAAAPGPRALLRCFRYDALRIWPLAAFTQMACVQSFFGRTLLLTSRPEDIRQVLIDAPDRFDRSEATYRILRPMFGDGLFLARGAAWKRQRQMLAPAFTPRSTGLVARTVAAVAEEHIGSLDANRAAGAGDGGVDLLAAMQTLALEVAGRTLFSFEMGADGARIRHLLGTYLGASARPGLLDFVAPAWLPLPWDLVRARVGRRWFALIEGLVRGRLARRPERPGGGAGDLLDQLLAARHPDTGAPLSARAVCDEVATLLLAGHETTALTLFWSLYVAALAPDWQEAVAQEAAACMLSVDSAEADLPRLPLATAFVQEILRLYPPAYVIARVTLAAQRLAERDVAPGTLVMIAPWVIHRHRSLWERPDAFDPRRFLPPAPAPDRFRYLPFGVGPRVCIGARFASTEAVLVLALMLRHFRITLADSTPVRPVAVITTQPERSPWFRLERR